MRLALCVSIHDTGCMIEYEWQYEHNYCIIAESKFDQSIGIVYVAIQYLYMARKIKYRVWKHSLIDSCVAF